MDGLWFYCKRAYREVEKVITKSEINQIIDESRKIWIEKHQALDKAKDDQDRLAIIFSGITRDEIEFSLLNDLYREKTGKDIPYTDNWQNVGY